MTHDELNELMKLDPAVIDTTTKALRAAIEFRNGRGRMLRQMVTGVEPTPAEIVEKFLKRMQK